MPKTARPFSLEQLDTPTGRILIVTDQQGCLRAVDWEDHAQRMERLLTRHYGGYQIQQRGGQGHSDAFRSLRAYFDGELDACASLRIAAIGTEFQQTVWSALRRIPAGSTVSYGALAKQIGRPKAARAVGRANGSNPIPIAVPCHRVIGSNSSLTGFGGGLSRKSWLLAHEQAFLEASQEQAGVCLA